MMTTPPMTIEEIREDLRTRHAVSLQDSPAAEFEALVQPQTRHLPEYREGNNPTPNPSPNTGRGITPPLPRPEYREGCKSITARDARHQVLGAIKIIERMSGVKMVTDVRSTELLVMRIDELEAQSQAKDAHIARLEKALDNVVAVLEPDSDNPFDLKPISKWNKGQLGNRIIKMVESINWAVLRAENELRPEVAVPLIAGPKD